MAIKRCPYCRAIIDERDQYCNNCGTQLLFPEDAFIDEDIPGEKILDVDEAPAAGEAADELTPEEPEHLPVTQPSSAFAFPESVADGQPAAKKKSRKPKKAEDEISFEEPLGSEDLDVKPSADLLFEEAFSIKPPEVKPAPKPALKPKSAPETESEIKLDLLEEDEAVVPEIREDALSASTDEIEEIARLMSSLEKKEETPAPPPREKPKVSSPPDLDAASFLEKDFGALRKDAGVPPVKDRTVERPGDVLRTEELPPWTADIERGLPVVKPHEKLEIPDLKDEKPAVPPLPADLSDIFSKFEDEPSVQDGAPVVEAEAESSRGEASSSDAWAEIPGRDEAGRDYVSDRLGRDRQGRERQLRDEARPASRRRAAGGSKIKAKVYDVLIIALCWAVAVWLATRILSVSLYELFESASVPLMLFLLTLGVAYFFLFLYFLGETLGDRLSSR
jgi:hypothetical protein